MQKATGNKSALLFPVLKSEILSILGSLNQYKHERSYIQSISLYNLQNRNSIRTIGMILLLLEKLLHMLLFYGSVVLNDSWKISNQSLSETSDCSDCVANSVVLTYLE